MTDSGRHGPDEEAGPTGVLVGTFAAIIVFIVAVTIVAVILVR